MKLNQIKTNIPYQRIDYIMTELPLEKASKLMQDSNSNDVRKTAAKISNMDSRLVYLDHGRDRVVFKINHPVYENYVLKIARGERGKKANEQEYNNYDNLKNTKYSDWLCPVDSISEDKSYLFMEKVNMNKGDYIPVVENLNEIISVQEIESYNVGKHPILGDVLIDYTYDLL